MVAPNVDNDYHEKLRAAARRELATRELCRRSFLAFVCYTFPEYMVNWHHRAITQVLESFARGEIRHLMIYAPPRHGKSQLVSRHFPAWLLGRNPELNVLCASHTQDLANAMSLDVQTIMASDSYLNVFKSTRIPSVASAEDLRRHDVLKADHFTIAQHRGSYRCAGVGGSITGKGFDIGIVDDPIKNREEADSAAYRKTLYGWFSSTFFTRRDQAAAQIMLTMTRWHDADLAGMVLKNAKENPDAPEWTVLWLPAVAEDHPPAELANNPKVKLLRMDPRGVGQALWPDKFDEKGLREIKGSITDRDWNALYQGRPAPEEGVIIKRATLQPYTIKGDDMVPAPGVLLPYRDLLIYNVMDLATSKKTQADYTVIGTFGIHFGAQKLFVLDWYRGRVSGGEHETLIRERWKTTGASYTAIESEGFQLELTQTMQKHGIPVREIPRQQGDKVARAHAAAQVLSRLCVYVPAAAGWLDEFMEEVTRFPFGLHDDQLDVLAYGVLHFDAMPLTREPVSATSRSTPRPTDNILKGVKPKRG